MAETTATTTLRLFQEGGAYRIPADTGLGGLYRPFAVPGAGRDERTATLETLYDFWINNVPDPDEAIRADPQFRDKLRMHPDVVSAMRKREKTVASYPDRIEPNPKGPDQELARKIADAVDEDWRSIPRLPQLYVHLQSAVLEGGAGVEFKWRRRPDGSEHPVDWFPIHKSRFVRDRLGNLALRTRLNPVWGANIAPNPTDLAQRTSNKPDDLAPLDQIVSGKFLYHVYRQEPGTWDRPELEGYVYWGAGEDIALYYPVTFDVFVLRARMKWIEKYGDPPTDIYYPEAAAGDPQITQTLKRIADSVRGESITIIPFTMPGSTIEQNGWQVHQRDVPGPSYDAFERFSDGWVKKRVDAILLGSADENQKAEHGGYSDHVSRKESGPQVFFTYDAANISGTINSQLMPAMVQGRFPNLPPEYWPIHKLEPKEERDRSQEAEIIESVSALVPLSEDEVYEKTGFRKPNPGEKTISNPGQQPGGGMFDGMDFGGGEGEPKPKGAIGQNGDRGSFAGKPGKPPQPIKQRTMPRM